MADGIEFAKNQAEHEANMELKGQRVFFREVYVASIGAGNDSERSLYLARTALDDERTWAQESATP